MQIITAKDSSSAKSLDDAIKRGNIIVLIYADWCPHCVQFKPEWARFKQAMQQHHRQHGGPMCHIGEVEQSHLDSVPSAKAQGFPTIKFYRSPVTAIAAGESNSVRRSSRKAVGSQKTKKVGNNNVPYLGRVPIEHNPFAKVIMERAAAADPELDIVSGPEPEANNEVIFEGKRSVEELVKFANDNARQSAPTVTPVKKKSTSRKVKKAKAKKASTKKVKKSSAKKAKKASNTAANNGERSVSQEYKEEKTKRDPVVMQELNSEFNNMASNSVGKRA